MYMAGLFTKVALRMAVVIHCIDTYTIHCGIINLTCRTCSSCYPYANECVRLIERKSFYRPLEENSKSSLHNQLGIKSGVPVLSFIGGTCIARISIHNEMGQPLKAFLC